MVASNPPTSAVRHRGRESVSNMVMGEGAEVGRVSLSHEDSKEVVWAQEDIEQSKGYLASF